MAVMIFTMLIVLVLAAGVIAVVVMGMEGTGSKQHPEIADAMARTARHLNGEGEPPRALQAVVDEMDEVGDLNVRHLPGKIRARASAASARSAASAPPPPPADPAVPSASPVAPPSQPEPAQPSSGQPTSAQPTSAQPTSEAAATISAALAAPVPEDGAAHDPYGIWGPTDPDDLEADTIDRRASVVGDTVARVRLPGGDASA